MEVGKGGGCFGFCSCVPGLGTECEACEACVKRERA